MNIHEKSILYQEYSGSNLKLALDGLERAIDVYTQAKKERKGIKVKRNISYKIEIWEN
jgi:hypothetical protein